MCAACVFPFSTAYQRICLLSGNNIHRPVAEIHTRTTRLDWLRLAAPRTHMRHATADRGARHVVHTAGAQYRAQAAGARRGVCVYVCVCVPTHSLDAYLRGYEVSE